MKDTHKKLLLFTLIAVFSITLGNFTLEPKTAVHLFRDYGYFGILLIFTLFLFFLYRVTKPWLKKNDYFLSKDLWFQKKSLVFILIFLACFSIIRVHEREEFKIIMDEPLISATAYSMHTERKAIVPTRAFNLNGSFMLGGGFVDKRPPFFPFLTSIIHDLTGYRFSNPFTLNFILTGVFLLLAYQCGRVFINHTAGLLAMVLFTSTPLLSNTANGSGFELLNLSMLLATLLAAKHYLKIPSADSLSLLCLSFILLANVRYESALYVIPVGLIILLSWYQNKRFIFSPIFFATPILLIPYLWNHQSFKLNEKFWELQSIKDADTPFALKYVFDNIGHATNFFFDFTPHLPNSPLLAYSGLICCLLFAVYIFRTIRLRQRISTATQVFACFCLAFLLHLAMLMAYFYGQLDTSIIQRLSLPLHVPLVYCTLFILFGLHTHKYVRRSYIFLTALFIAAYTLPTTSKHLYTNRYQPRAGIAWLNNYIASQKASPPDLVISPFPWFWIQEGIPAISYPSADQPVDKLAYFLKDRLHPSNVIIQQELAYDFEAKEYVPRLDKKIDPRLITKLIKEEQVTEMIRVRIHKLVDVKDATPIPTFPEVPEGETLLYGAYVQHQADNLP